MVGSIGLLHGVRRFTSRGSAALMVVARYSILSWLWRTIVPQMFGRKDKRYAGISSLEAKTWSVVMKFSNFQTGRRSQSFKQNMSNYWLINAPVAGE